MLRAGNFFSMTFVSVFPGSEDEEDEEEEELDEDDFGGRIFWMMPKRFVAKASGTVAPFSSSVL